MFFVVFVVIVAGTFFGLKLYWLLILGAMGQAILAYSVRKNLQALILLYCVTIPFLSDQLLVPNIFDSADFTSILTFAPYMTMLIASFVLIVTTKIGIFDAITAGEEKSGASP